MLADGVENGVEQWDQRGDTLKRKSLRAQIARLQDLLEKVGADQAFQNFSLVDFGLRAFHAFRDPAAPLQLRQVHEVCADCAAINAASFFGSLAGQPFQIRLREWPEKAERIKLGFVVTPAAKRVKDALAIIKNSRFFGG